MKSHLAHPAKGRGTITRTSLIVFAAGGPRTFIHRSRKHISPRPWCIWPTPRTDWDAPCASMPRRRWSLGMTKRTVSCVAVIARPMLCRKKSELRRLTTTNDAHPACQCATFPLCVGRASDVFCLRPPPSRGPYLRHRERTAAPCGHFRRRPSLYFLHLAFHACEASPLSFAH